LCNEIILQAQIKENLIFNFLIDYKKIKGKWVVYSKGVFKDKLASLVKRQQIEVKGKPYYNNTREHYTF